MGDNSGEIKNSYAVGYVHGEDDVGGLMGRNTGDVFDSYYNSETTGQEDNDGRGTPITTEEMKDPDTFAEWDFDDIWEIATGTYPYLQWQTNNFDFAHPLFAEDYPRAENIFYDSFDLLAEVDEDATVYYVVLPVEADAPDALQVSSGKDADDKDADLSGSLRVEAAVETQLTISGLNPKTAYRIFAAVEDDAENLQSAVSTFEVTTLAQPDPANSSVSAIDPESPQIYASFTITAEVRDGENEPITGLSAGTFSLTGGAGSFTVDSIGEDGATGNYIVTARYDTLGTINISIHVMGIKVGEINNVVIQKSEQEAPASPVIESRTTTGITLEDMGGQVEYSRDSGATWQDSPVFEGLNINTEYSFVARLKETATHKLSPESEPVSGYTLAAVPGLTAVADGTDTIDLTVDLAGNPEGTEYEIQRSEDSDFNNIFTAMDWGENTVFSDIGVIQNTTYYYRVMARNGEGTETSWSETAEATTEQDEQDTHPAPADVTVPAEAVFGEEITVDWSAVAGTTGYIMQVSTDGGITWGADVAKGVATSHEYTIAGMEDHIFRVKAMRDGFTDSGWTLSDAVSINKANREAPDAPVIESRTTTSITLSDMGGDIGYSRDGGNTWQSERTFTDLSPGTEYTFVARFIGTDTHNPSDMSEGVSGFTSEITPGQGILIVTINPEGARVAGAQWSVDGGITWFDSGAEELTVGTYTVTFEDIPGWDTPDLITDVEVTEGDTDLVAEYTRHTGTLTVTIEPEGAVNAGAQWRLTTGTDTAWKDSGDTIGNIPTGEYTVEFEDVDGYNTPDELTVTIVKDEETTETATYTRHTGTLTVTIEPEDARIAEAQWRVEGDATWRDSGDVLTLDAGTYTIYFKPIGGWNTPSSIETEVTVGGDITETAEYEPLALGTGSLNVIITPRDAREAGAQWSVDGGTTWYDGGHSLNKNAGTYTITFKPIDGWDTPDPIEDIVLADGASITEEAEYTRHTGTLTVTIDPEDAVNAGAQWRLTTGPDTAWKDSGDTIGSIPIGEYTVVFKDAEGYNTPDELTVTIVKDVETTETATYILHTDEPIKYGDVNGQGSITVSDAILVLRHIVGLTELDDDALKRAKVNDGENLTVSDAILILRKIVGLIDGFPVEG